MEVYLALVIILISIIGSPGPNNTFLFVSGMQNGFLKTIPILLAINMGVILMSYIAYSGATLLTTIIPEAQLYLKWFAILFLLFMAYSMWPKKNDVESNNSSIRFDIKPIWLFFFQFINPKIWLIVLAIISSFQSSLSIFSIAFTILLVGLIFNSFWIYAGSFIGKSSYNKNKNDLFLKIGSLLILSSVVFFFFKN